MREEACLKSRLLGKCGLKVLILHVVSKMLVWNQSPVMIAAYMSEAFFMPPLVRFPLLALS